MRPGTPRSLRMEGNSRPRGSRVWKPCSNPGGHAGAQGTAWAGGHCAAGRARLAGRGSVAASPRAVTGRRLVAGIEGAELSRPTLEVVASSLRLVREWPGPSECLQTASGVAELVRRVPPPRRMSRALSSPLGWGGPGRADLRSTTRRTPRCTSTRGSVKLG